MRILQYAAASGRRAKALAILLPGALQQPEDLVRAGFIDTVRERRLSLDLWLPDLLICRPEWAEPVLEAVAKLQAA